MKTPDDRDLLAAWERGWGGTPTERALALLSVSFPEKQVEQLANLTVGRRDGLLLTLRKRLFGSNLEVVVNCPSCGEELEFSANVDDLRVAQISPDDPGTEPVEVSVEHDDWRLSGRVPTAGDLLLLERSGSSENLVRQLLRRCLQTIEFNGDERPVEALPDPVVTRMDDRFRERDPQAEILFDLDCPACDERWETVFDIAEYLWTEVDVEARRLMRQIDRLAWAYGWSENEILDLAPFRRNCYLDLLEDAS